MPPGPARLIDRTPDWLGTRLRGVTDLLYPVACLSCGETVSGPIRLCPDCRAELARMPEGRCPLCGRPDCPSGTTCGGCQRRPPAFAGVHAPLRYTEPLAGWIRQFKYGQEPGLEHTLAVLAAEGLDPWLAEAGVDLVVATPLHRRRLAERGYNQALLLGRRLARARRLPFSGTALGRTRATPPQASLPEARRRANVRGAFVASPRKVAGRRIALVDDVVTTGATMDAAARALNAAGAAAVYVVAVARA